MKILPIPLDKIVDKMIKKMRLRFGSLNFLLYISTVIEKERYETHNLQSFK
jgi:hypothetical protein